MCVREPEKLATVEFQVSTTSSISGVGGSAENPNLVHVMEYGKSVPSRPEHNARLQHCLLKLLNSSGYLAGKLPFKSATTQFD